MMRKWVSFLVSLILFLTTIGTALALGPVSPTDSDPTWQAAYWNNMTLTGTPVLERAEIDLNHNWETGSPHASVHADGFSARWTKYIYVTAGTYRFTATSDDGVRVWVDGDLIINEWNDHPARTFSAEKHLLYGHHWVVVEFYENQGMAVAKLEWGPAAPSVQAWRGEYFDNMTPSGTPVLVRDDSHINFDWGPGSPAPGVIGVDNFSARWTRTLDLPAGRYRFETTVDDGVRLWVNNHLLIESWKDQPATTYTGDIYLPGGPIPIKMEYYENTDRAVARLSWVAGSIPPSPGTVIVDDTDPGFVKGGRPASWRTVFEGYNGRLLWTWNNDWQRHNYNWARWYPSLAPGHYEVFVFIPYRFTTTWSAQYSISHANGVAVRVVNQDANGDRWVSLGTYIFNGANGDYVSLTDVTGESRLTRLIAFDAMKWVPR